MTNFDPMALTDQQRFEFNQRIDRNPRGFVYVEIRPDGPGGSFPIQGAIKTRSMLQILTFLAKGIRTAPEFVVDPDPRTGEMAANPAATLRLNVTDAAPDASVPFVLFRGRYYSVNDSDWDRSSFALLNTLFQTTVGKVENVGIPVTISK